VRSASSGLAPKAYRRKKVFDSPETCADEQHRIRRKQRRDESRVVRVLDHRISIFRGSKKGSFASRSHPHISSAQRNVPLEAKPQTDQNLLDSGPICRAVQKVRSTRLSQLQVRTRANGMSLRALCAGDSSGFFFANVSWTKLCNSSRGNREAMSSAVVSRSPSDSFASQWAPGFTRLWISRQLIENSTKPLGPCR